MALVKGLSYNAPYCLFWGKPTSIMNKAGEIHEKEAEDKVVSLPNNNLVFLSVFIALSHKNNMMEDKAHLL